MTGDKLAVLYLGIAITFLFGAIPRCDRQRVTLYSWNRNPASRKDNLVYGFTIPGLEKRNLEAEDGLCVSCV